jgi:hypothetical protein
MIPETTGEYYSGFFGLEGNSVDGWLSVLIPVVLLGLLIWGLTRENR